MISPRGSLYFQATRVRTVLRYDLRTGAGEEKEIPGPATRGQFPIPGGGYTRQLGWRRGQMSLWVISTAPEGDPRAPSSSQAEPRDTGLEQTGRPASVSSPSPAPSSSAAPLHGQQLLLLQPLSTAYDTGTGSSKALTGPVQEPLQVQQHDRYNPWREALRLGQLQHGLL